MNETDYRNLPSELRDMITLVWVARALKDLA
jgi:hypothetical protein